MKLATVGNRVAKGCDSGVVVRSAPLAVQVGEPIDVDRRSGTLGILAEQVLPRQLGFAVNGTGVTPLKGRLSARGEHNGAVVAMMFKQPEQLRSEPEVALHEVLGVLRAVHAGKIEYEVCLRAVERELLAGAVDVVLVDRERQKALVALAAVLAVADALERLAEVPAHEPLGAGDKDLHY